MSEVNNIKILLSRVGLIVNNVVTDWTTENISAMRVIVTHTVKYILGKNDLFAE